LYSPTPRGAGIGILAALVFSALASGMSMAFWLLVGALAILAFWGDRIDLSAKLRLYAQLFLIALLVVGTG
jgi:Fuc2NAc and GlcNAc transferase